MILSSSGVFVGPLVSKLDDGLIGATNRLISLATKWITFIVSRPSRALPCRHCRTAAIVCKFSLFLGIESNGNKVGWRMYKEKQNPSVRKMDGCSGFFFLRSAQS